MQSFHSGLVLFVFWAGLAVTSLYAVLNGISSGGRSDISALALAAAPIVSVAFITVMSLVVLALRGRRHPLSDGLAIMAVVTILGTLALALTIRQDARFPDSNPVFWHWSIATLYLTFLLLTYPPSYLLLCRTPLLRGLAPVRNKKGPAEASP